VGALFAVHPAPVDAQGQLDRDELRREIERQRQQIERQAERLEAQHDALSRQQERLNSLQERLDSLEDIRARGRTPAGGGADGTGSDRDGATGGQRTTDGQRSRGGQRTVQADGGQEGSRPPQQERETERPQIRVLEQEGGVLLGEGQFAFEPSLQYTNTSVNRVEIAGFSVLPAIVVGEINIEQLDRESVVASNTFRYGVTDTFELEVRVPYVWRSESETSRPTGTGTSDPQTFDTTGSGLGDVEIAAHYQLPTDWTGDGFVVTNLRLKSRTGEGPFEVDTTGSGNNERQADLPTGTGFYSVTPSVTGILPTDPAVLFGNLSYEYTVARDISGVGEVDPGDQLGINVGTGISLNPDFSVSLALDHTVVFETERDGEPVEGSDVVHVSSFLVGGTYDVTDNVSIDLQFGVGATEDAPDFTATLSVPITFQGF
jgi:hypothetical protein